MVFINMKEIETWILVEDFYQDKNMNTKIKKMKAYRIKPNRIDGCDVKRPANPYIWQYIIKSILDEHRGSYGIYRREDAESFQRSTVFVFSRRSHDFW